MAAHTLTIINQTLYEGREITETVCEQIEFACGHAKGMDIPCLDQEDWALIHEAARTRSPRMLKVALENVLPRVRYQAAYQSVEHLARARALYVKYDTWNWEERSRMWALLPQNRHESFARLAHARTPVLASV